MSAELVNLVVYSSVLFNRTGQIRRWADGVERQFTANAIMAAPLNKRQNKSRSQAAFPPGSMKSSISGNVDRIGPAHLETTISVNVPYALYVIEGTSGAVATGGDDWRSWMYVPPNPGFGTRTRHQFTRGQAANNFLATALNMTSRTHPSLRGLEANAFQSF